MRAAFLFGACCALILTSCATDGEILSSGDRYVAPNVDQEAYRLGVGDKVRIIVYGETDLTREFIVGGNGTVSLPLAGEVKATGLTTAELAQRYATQLSGGYLRQPKVSAEVVVYRPFYILGEVGEAGQYPYALGMTALSAVATAKGFTPRANRDVVHIRREGEATEKAYKITPELRVYAGDTVRVSERWF